MPLIVTFVAQLTGRGFFCADVHRDIGAKNIGKTKLQNLSTHGLQEMHVLFVLVDHIGNYLLPCPPHKVIVLPAFA